MGGGGGKLQSICCYQRAHMPLMHPQGQQLRLQSRPWLVFFSLYRKQVPKGTVPRLFLPTSKEIFTRRPHSSGRGL